MVMEFECLIQDMVLCPATYFNFHVALGLWGSFLLHCLHVNDCVLVSKRGSLLCLSQTMEPDEWNQTMNCK